MPNRRCTERVNGEERKAVEVGKRLVALCIEKTFLAESREHRAESIETVRRQIWLLFE
jgi:hypothetical protein